jgi:carboxypeptidase C (cathepsin A)
MRMLRRPALTVLMLLAAVSIAAAQGRPSRQERSAEANPAESAQPAGPGVLRLLPPDAVSDKQINIGGRTIAYTAIAGTLSLFDQSGERSAAVFYTAYVAKGANAANRPVTFVFNGGPGAASAYLHLGLAGPRIIDYGPQGHDGATAKLADNPDSWLAFTDLVMIDPVGTGWSRPAKPEGGSQYRSISGDASSIAKVIALYVAHNSRSASPKYILGESYGGFRAAKVARALQSEQGIIAAGIVMVSPMLETSFLWNSGRDPFIAALQFPALAATELERTKTYTPEAMAEAERFALTDYLTTLAGPPPVGDAAKAFHERIARMTGLAPDAVARTRGYVRQAYVEHLRSQGVQVSSYDASFALANPFPDHNSNDPMLDGFLRALSGVFVGYARDELGFKTDMTYVLLNREQWDWGGGRTRPGASEDLRTMLTLHPSFRLLVSHGRSDLVTPYGVSRYLLDQLSPAGAPERVQLKTYRGGHMFYFTDTERRAFTNDAKAFYQSGP